MTKPETVAVVYYLSRNSKLEHPHFMDVPLSSSQGLFLKDVIHRLNFLRGKGMASSYSWSAKRSYKNGYVWHDLEEDDLIQPANGDYILKGSEILPEPSASSETASSDGERRFQPEKKQEEMSREEISPPPTSDSSPETLESLMKADGRLVLDSPSSSIQIVNRAKSPPAPPQSILMSIVSCGSISFRNALRFPRGGNRAVESYVKDEVPACKAPNNNT